MKRNIVFWMVLIVAIAAVVGFYIYLQNRRYYITSPAGEVGVAYKIDRKTGRTWMIRGGKEVLVQGSDKSNQQQSPEDEAIEMAKKSSVLGGSAGAEYQIQNWLKGTKGNLRINGWKALKVDDQRYLVSYTWDEDSGERGYYFEVNLVAEIVRNVLSDPELRKRYGLPKGPILLPDIE